MLMLYLVGQLRLMSSFRRRHPIRKLPKQADLTHIHTMIVNRLNTYSVMGLHPFLDRDLMILFYPFEYDPGKLIV